MDTAATSETPPMKDTATAERISERELVVSRIVRAAAATVFEAWTRPELFRRWWVPKSFPVSLLSCEMDARVGGRYRLAFGHEGSTFEFFGRYLEVIPAARLVWTNEEEDGGPVTTVTFEEAEGGTRVVVHELYPSKESLDEAIASGSAGIDGMPEQLAQLDELLVSLGTPDGGS